MSVVDLKTVRMREWRDSLATSRGNEEKSSEVLRGKVPVSREGAATLLGDLNTLAYLNPAQLTVRVDLAKIADILAHASTKLPANSSNKLLVEADFYASVSLHEYLISVGFSRQLAGDDGIWMWLNLNVPDWALARWKSSYEPWFGGSTSNALGRLFWASELIRNGSDYTPVRGAFLAGQNVINEINREIYRSRHWAIALSVLAADFDGKGSSATDAEWNIVAKVADKIAFLNRPEAAPLDEELMFFGDDDPAVAYAADPSGIASVQQLLGRYLAGIAGTKRIRANKLYCPDGSR